MTRAGDQRSRSRERSGNPVPEPRARTRPGPSRPSRSLPRSAPLLALLLALPLVLALPACGRRPSPSASAQPRYVVLSPALAIMLRDLGQEDRIVARHAYDMVLDESLPVAGELGRIDYETLLAARPTHVLIEWGAMSQPLPDRLVSLARERGFEIQRYSMLTLPDIIAAVDRLESTLPPSDRAPEQGYWHDRMARAWAAPPTDPNSPPRFESAGRVLLLASTSPTIAAFGPGSWHHQILHALGGIPAITQGAAWIELSPEDVVRLAPDAIIVIQPRQPDLAPDGLLVPGDPAAQLGTLGRLDIPAIRRNRVALIDDPLAHTPSTAMVGLTEQVERIMRAWSPPPSPAPERGTPSAP